MPISNTLDYTPIYSGTSVRKVVKGSDLTPITVEHLLDGIDIALVAATMSRTDILYPVGTSTFPFSTPFVSTTTSTAPTIAHCGRAFLTVGGQPFTGYNPYAQTPGVGGNCVLFPWGTSPAETLLNLAVYVTANTPFNCSVGPGATLVYIAKAPGPAFNFIPINPDGEWGFGGTPDGGGYVYDTVLRSDTTQYTITITGVSGGYSGYPFDPYDGVASIKITTLGGDATFLLDCKMGTGNAAIREYHILANPHGFTVFDPDNDTHPLSLTSFFVAAPRISEFTDCTDLVVMLNPGAFRATTCAWTGYVEQNGEQNAVNFNNGPKPKPLMLRSPGPTTLTTLANTPIVMGTYLQLGNSNVATPKVCGKLWDCVMVSDYIETGLLNAGKRHETVSKQTGTTSSTTDTGGSTFNTRSTLLWGYNTEV